MAGWYIDAILLMIHNVDIMRTSSRYTTGFTIVELLIVIVVIAILAAITIVSYNGVSRQAKDSALKSDINAAYKQLSVTQTTDGAYPATDAGLKKSNDTTFIYGLTANGYCLSATITGLSGVSYYTTQAGGIQSGVCPPNVPTTMQAFTQTHCDSLTTYTGSNQSAIISLTDTRAGSQDYEVAKFADNRCWMIENLRLGSTSGTTLLTPTDSNVGANYTLPQAISPGDVSRDAPRVYGPITGDSGAAQSATNYGLLYNWPAAAARTSLAGSGEPAGAAPYSICPAGWRLPTGTSTGEFAWLNAKMNNPAAASPSTTNYYANWYYTGAFKGVFAGYGFGNYSGQGTSGGYWARELISWPSANAAYMSSSNNVIPAHTIDRVQGYSVRCILN